jgi:uncharacterized membrane protein YvbJ
MALVPCKECGKEVSDKAATCPGCGVSLRKRVASVDSNSKTPLESKKTNPFAFSLMASGLIIMLVFRSSGTTFLGLLLILSGVVWDIYNRFFKRLK